MLSPAKALPAQPASLVEAAGPALEHLQLCKLGVETGPACSEHHGSGEQRSHACKVVAESGAGATWRGDGHRLAAQDAGS